MHRRRLPIGIQAFAKIRADDHYYVDKTGFIAEVVLERDEFHGEWNYRVKPRHPGG